jgi:hypothetical protein
MTTSKQTEREALHAARYLRDATTPRAGIDPHHEQKETITCLLGLSPECSPLSRRASAFLVASGLLRMRNLCAVDDRESSPDHWLVIFSI